MSGHNWRWWFHAIHRDVGYFCVGLTLIYAISGVAVNHVADWNPNYAIAKVKANIGPVEHGPEVDDALAKVVLGKLELSPDYLTLFQPGPHELRILRDNHTIDIDLQTGNVQHEVITPRPVLHEMNYLHLNHGKELWTWIADAFAVALALLAITGMFLLKGKNGILGRGMWLTAAGVALPLVYLWLA